LEYSDIWAVVQNQMDIAVRWEWEELHAKGVDYKMFSKPRVKLLGMLMAEEDILDILGCDDQFDKVPLQVKRVIEGSLTGASMFKHAWLQVCRALFKIDCEKKLKDVIHLDFDQDAVEDFKRCMVQTASQVVAVGGKCFERRHMIVEYISQKIDVEVESPNDEWEFSLLAAMKSIAINGGQLPMLPWEALLYSPGDLDAFPAFAKIPDSLLVEVVSAREAALSYLGTNNLTIRDMIKIMNGRSGALKQLERTFELDMVFLTERVEQLLIDRVHKEVLEALPPLVEHTLTIKKVASILMAENSQIKTPIFQTIQAWHL
jgi:hypothetical protein